MGKGLDGGRENFQQDQIVQSNVFEYIIEEYYVALRDGPGSRSRLEWDTEHRKQKKYIGGKKTDTPHNERSMLETLISDA
jgi:hypothetical protein